MTGAWCRSQLWGRNGAADVGGLGRKRALPEIEHAGALKAGLARREKAQLTSIEKNRAAVGR
jgi:hypothetical protein